MTSSRPVRGRAPPSTRRRSRRTERTPKINDIVDIWWAVDKTFYRGRLTRQYESDTTFRILYDDGETEDLDLVNEYWKFAEDNKPAPQPDADEIIDVVLDGSHHQQTQKNPPPPQSATKKQKPKTPKPPAANLNIPQSADDSRDKDYVAETPTTQPTTTKQKRSKPDSDKAKKRPKKPRKQPPAPEKTTTPARPNQKVAPESSRRTRQHREEHVKAGSNVPDQPNTIPTESTSGPAKASPRRQNSTTDPKQPLISREGVPSTLKTPAAVPDVTVSQPAQTTAPSVSHTEMTHRDKSKKSSKPGKNKTATAEISLRREDANGSSQLPSKTRHSGTQRLSDTAATSLQKAGVRKPPIISQRDLATIQAEPSLLPSERHAFTSATDPVASTPNAVNKSNGDNPLVPQLTQAEPAGLPTPSGGIDLSKSVVNSDAGSMPNKNAQPMPPQHSTSVPVKVALRPRGHQENVNGPESSTASRGRGPTPAEASGLRDTDASADGAGGHKRSRENDEPMDDAANKHDNPHDGVKRAKGNHTVAIPTVSNETEGMNTLTHFPEQDTALTTLVNRRLNPIERHLRLLSDNVQSLSQRVDNQLVSSSTLLEALQNARQDIEKELGMIKEVIRTAQAARDDKYDEILRYVREVKDSIQHVPPGQGRQAYQRSLPRSDGTPNGYNADSLSYQLQGTAAAVAPAPVARNPVGFGQLHNAPTVPMMPLQDVDSLDGADSDDDVNLSPRRVAAPGQNPDRNAAAVSASKLPEMPQTSEGRITHIVGRQVTVWLLETPHEHNPAENNTLAAWTEKTTARAYGRVAERLSQFDDYGQAYQTLSTSLGHDSVEMTWFTNPENLSNIARARKNYAAWDPPPSDAEWQFEMLLLAEVAKAFHRAMDKSPTNPQDDLDAAVEIAKSAATAHAVDSPVPAQYRDNRGRNAMLRGPRTDGNPHRTGTQFAHSSQH